MLRKLSIIFISLLFLVPAYTQTKKDSDKKTDDTTTKIAKIYQEIVLENFEETLWTKKNIIFQKTKNQKADISIRDQYPAPYKNSKKYLGFKIFGKQGDVLKIRPTKELIIEKYCKEISLWVYGKRFSGELSVLLQDSKKRNHRLIFGKLNFLGWRKMRIKLTKNIKQEDLLLSQKQQLKIFEFQYRPANRTRRPIWQYFYLDDLSAYVRDKYTDRQDDNW